MSSRRAATNNNWETFISRLQSQGLFTEDPDGTYSGVSAKTDRERKYYVQLDGHQLTKPYWTEPTIKNVIKYLREELKDFPDAMILKTEYIHR